MTIDEAEDHRQISRLCDTFAIAAMRKDLDAWGRTWAAEGVWNLPVFEAPVRGRDNIIKAFGARFDATKLLSMAPLAREVDLDGDRATGKIHYQEIIFLANGDPRKFVMGCYHDEYRRVDGAWLFAARDYEVFGRA